MFLSCENNCNGHLIQSYKDIIFKKIDLKNLRIILKLLMLPAIPTKEKPKKYRLRSPEVDNKIIDCIKDSIPNNDIRYNKQSDITNCSWCNREFISIPYRERWCDVTCCGMDSAYLRSNK